MKRSEANGYIKEALAIFETHHFHLPVWCHWNIEQWQANKEKCDEIFATQLGWDITDFGSGDYLRRGLFLITLRNGGAVPYNE